MPEIKRFCFNLFREHCFVIWKDKDKAVVVDPGMYKESENKEFVDFLETEHISLCGVLLTHAHSDHIYGAKFLQEKYGLDIYMSPEDKVIFDFNNEICRMTGMNPTDCTFITKDISDGDILDLGGMSFKVITTPGHTPGGVCYLDEEDKIMFTGDTLLAGCIGRTDFKHSDYDKEIVSIMEKLMFLDGGIRIFPGHGGSSTIAEERTENPFLQPFNEPEDCIVEQD